MLGREGEKGFLRWHMSPAVTATHSSAINPDSFSKDGRKIQVGDCALFKPPEDFPPFVGIIRRLILSKEDCLNLHVNWLYRPADVKLLKGIFPEAAPNEVFFSFHKDEIPAASLLHPCKVAFLQEGADLPLGISSFVCRRVYDIENKRLWWLTDQNYIADRQEEVDQLLGKTTLEMQGAVQLGGHSPENLNGPTATAQVKPITGSAHNSSSSCPLVKGKKREHGVQCSEPVKRECILRTDDVGSGKLRPELVLKSEIAKITDKGGLVDFEGVEKLVQLMHPDGAEKKIDLPCRIMLVDVIGVTEKLECLGRFVQLRGLSVFDKWIQEVHRAKIGDAIRPNESDSSMEQFLLVLLRALDKLPVNLHALQTCNIGKSVNHLRTHKNSEIHKKARSLVEAWKKRVEAEMNMLDAKSGSSRGASWSTKSVILEMSHVGNRRSGGSCEVGVKSSIVQSSASKTLSAKLVSGDAVTKISLWSPCSTKSTASVSTSGFPSTKDTNSVTMTGGGSSDPLTTGEEKTSSSNQSQNNSLSFSSDLGKTGASSREDARSSTVVNKLSSVSRNRKSSSVVHRSVVSLVENESSSEKASSLNKNSASEKVLPTSVTSDGVHHLPLVSNGNFRRLVVKLPNTCLTPTRSSSGGSPEDSPASFCKGSHCEKLDHLDQKVKEKGDALPTTSASNININYSKGKDNLAVPREINDVHCDEQTGGSLIGEKLIKPSNAICSSSEVTLKTRKSFESSFSSLNALAESCVKFAEASAYASVGDDIGINLLASVAAGEMSRSDVLPPSSPRRESAVPDDSCSGNDVKLRTMDDNKTRSGYQGNDGAMRALGSSVDSLRVRRGFEGNAVPASISSTGDSKVALLNCEGKMAECVMQLNSSSTSFAHNGNGPLLMFDGNPLDVVQDASANKSYATVEGTNKDERAAQFDETRKLGVPVARRYTDSNSKVHVNTPISDEYVDADCLDENSTGNIVVVVAQGGDVSAKFEVKANEESPCCSSSEVQGDDKKSASGSGILAEQKLPNVVCGKTEGNSPQTGTCNALDMESVAEKVDDLNSKSQNEKSEKPKLNYLSSIADHKCGSTQEISNKEVVFGNHPGGSQEVSQAISKQKNEGCLKSSECKSDGVGGDIGEASASTVDLSSFSAAGSDEIVKLDFDLNEGLLVDDGSFGELDKVYVPENTSSAHLLCRLPITDSSIPASLHASVTVAAAVKGPFPTPENPTGINAELGWKGSAATSAFLPAEPRKVLKMPLDTHAPPVGKPTTKQPRHLLDFDLNVTDVTGQRVSEDVASQKPVPVACPASASCEWRGGRLNLDLNRCDESPEIGQISASSSCKLDFSKFPGRSLFSGGSSKNELTASRNFDLNFVPSLDEGASETTLHAKSSMPFLSYVPGVGINNREAGNFSSWFATSNTFSAVAIPPILPGRGGQSYPIIPGIRSQRILGTPTCSSPFGSEIYMGPVLSSSPAISLPPTAPFQFPRTPFESNYNTSANSGAPTAFVDSSSAGPLCFPAIPPQLVGPTGVISSPYPRQYVRSPTSAISNASYESKKWGSHQGLDLNAGPGGPDVDRRDDRLPSALSQLLVAGSQGPADEQLKMYQQMAGEVLKRKEPDSGWEGDRINYKHPWLQ